MAQVTVKIHNRTYQVACEDGQETHLAKLAAYLDTKVTEIADEAGPAAQMSDSRLLVMAGLVIADELADAYDELQELRAAQTITEMPDPKTVREAEEACIAAEKERDAARSEIEEARAACFKAMEELTALRAKAEAAEAAAKTSRAGEDEVAAAIEALARRVAALSARVAAPPG
ncbi:MAG: cell division protein ZapA [Rhodospirillales bacterium]|nr:cell division protein ZapA [Rhodospirillales bacterium]